MEESPQARESTPSRYLLLLPPAGLPAPSSDDVHSMVEGKSWREKEKIGGERIPSK
jgi:hypothetical protein